MEIDNIIESQLSSIYYIIENTEENGSNSNKKIQKIGCNEESNNFKVINHKLPNIPEKDIKKWLELCCGGRFRFTVIFPILVLLIIPIPLLIPLNYTFILVSFYSIQLIIFIILGIFSHCQISSTIRNLNKTTKQQNIENTENGNKDFIFIMAVCIYKEPQTLIIDTLNNITNIIDIENSILLINLEEKYPDKDQLIKIIQENYKNKFQLIIIAVHPKDIPGEIPGKCSNFNYGIRSLYEYLKISIIDFDERNYFVLNFDIDTRFHECFLQVAKRTINKDPDPHNSIFQPILYYNWGLDKVSFITRIISLTRNFMMMAVLVPLNINIMSVYFASLDLYKRGKYTHPAYQMEDIICYIRWMSKTRRYLRIKPIYFPCISGPTSGNTYFEDISEFSRQLRRWSIGSSEVFHYFIIKWKKIGFFNSLLWGTLFINYYAGIQCLCFLLNIPTLIAILLKGSDQNFSTNYFFIHLGIFYVFICTIFILNSVSLKWFEDIVPKENISIPRNILHYFISSVALIFSSSVVLYGFIETIIMGKKVCKHGVSKKISLANV